jgi:4-hydroxy-2-oxoglutarate aldolase
LKDRVDIATQETPLAAGLRANLRGILLPFTTPFTSSEELDLDALRSNIQHWNHTGISGYVALGSTGERVNLSEREYLQVIETARAEVAGGLSLIAGAGQQSTLQTINEVKLAAAAGAEAVLVLTPSFYRSAITPVALLEHYNAVADAAPIPVILYSMPDLTGVVIEPETVAQLSQHSNIIGIKDSSNDISRFKETVRQAANGFIVMTGNGTVLFDALSNGAHGAILAVGCVAAGHCLKIFQCFKGGDLESAARLQEILTPLALAVTKRYGIGGLKTALDFVGLSGGKVRRPLRAPDEIACREIAQLLEPVINSRQDKAGFVDPIGFSGALRT